MLEQWSQFEDDIDDVVSISVRFVQIAGEDVNEGDSAKPVEKVSASWLPPYTPEQLQEK